MSFLLFIGYGLGAISITRFLKPQPLVASVFIFSAIFIGLILISGYALSELNYLGEVWAWMSLASLLGACGLVYLIWSGYRDYATLRIPFRSIDISSLINQMICALTNLGVIKIITLVIALATVLYLNKVNLYLVLKIAPGNWDSMTYHLARMAYYLQQGNLQSFNADYWAQVVHPKNATILMIFSFLGSGRNENWTQLIQYSAYWLSMISVFGISRILNISRSGSLFSALIFGLLTTSLMEATTTQNDLLIAALIGCSVYGVLAWGKNKGLIYLFLSIMSTSIAIGVKSSALLALPALCLLFLIPLFQCCQLNDNQSKASKLNLIFQSIIDYSKTSFSARILVNSVAAISLFFIFTLPAGYLENWKLYQHPIGPDSVRQMHAFDLSTPQLLVGNGLKNSLRYSLEFLSLDGFKNDEATKLQRITRQFMQSAFNWINLNLEEEKNVRYPFQFLRPPISHEDKSYWGVLGFLIIWPAVLLSCINKRVPIALRMLSFASLLFLLTQAFAGPFDPWRGRYFLTGAILATPICGYYFSNLLNKSLFLKIYFCCVTLLGCLSANEAIFYRENNIPTEVRQEDRLGQLLRNTGYKEQHTIFEKIVEPNASVAIALLGDSYEYPLFGEKLTRKIIPINHFLYGLGPVPREADYLMFQKDMIGAIEPTDILLGNEWYLRRIRK